MSKKKFFIIIAIVLITLAFPVSLVVREIYDLSDTMIIAIPSFILGIGIGLLISSLFMSSKRIDAEKE